MTEDDRLRIVQDVALFATVMVGGPMDNTLRIMRALMGEIIIPVNTENPGTPVDTDENMKTIGRPYAPDQLFHLYTQTRETVEMAHHDILGDFKALKYQYQGVVEIEGDFEFQNA